VVQIEAEVTQGSMSNAFKLDSVYVYQRDGW
jgi:hypothetical protein